MPGDKRKSPKVRAHFPEGVALGLGSEGRVGAGWAKMWKGVGGRESSNTERTVGTSPSHPCPVLPHLGNRCFSSRMLETLGSFLALLLPSDSHHPSPELLSGLPLLCTSMATLLTRLVSYLHFWNHPLSVLPNLLLPPPDCFHHQSGLLAAV